MTYKQEFYIQSTNEINKLHLIIWKPKADPIGILQISHGMIEYIDRYDEFARYLADRGYIVVGNDHLAHGKTVTHKEELGFFNAKDPSYTVVEDLHRVTLYMKKNYPDLPYFLLGHSMGSFMARRYLMTYGNELTGAIIMGTGRHSALSLKMAHDLVKLVNKFKPMTHRSKLLNKVCFGTYNRRFKPNKTSHDWLSQDADVVDAYLKDPLCTFTFTLNGYKTLFDTLSFIQEPSNMARIPKMLPIFMVAGDADPVGDYGKGVTDVYNSYKALGICDISLKLYKDARHELVNEFERQTVFSDIYNWLEKHR